MKTCKSCKYYNKEYEDNPYCDSGKIVIFHPKYDTPKDFSSSIVAIPNRGMRLTVGPNFGCVHHEESDRSIGFALSIESLINITKKLLDKQNYFAHKDEIILGYVEGYNLALEALQKIKSEIKNV